MNQQPEEGGTRIQRRPQQQVPQQDPQMEQQAMMQQQQAMMQQQQAMQQQQGYPQQQVYVPQAINRVIPPPLRGKIKSFDMDSQLFKNALLVTIIFVLLNSKLVWKQIIRFPFMGGVEPSIVALVVNSILAGILFYIISNYLMN